MHNPTFSGGSVDRATHLRARAEDLLRDAQARVLPLWLGKPLVDLDPGPRLAWLSPDDPILRDPPAPPIFLGTGSGPRFALDVSHVEGPSQEGASGFVDRATLDLSPTRKFIDLRTIMGELSADDAGDAASAKGVIEWHRSHLFCARCGSPSLPEDGGWRRGCPSCKAQHFPRTDPVVIMLVLHKGRALLGRQAVWPERMYSLLAGFMEPGETIEEAVRRETFEETGVRVGRVGYLVSQPWPFPSSLMIGCIAEAQDDAITIDDHELEAALWAPASEVVASFTGGPARFTAGRKGAVARMILESWVDGRTPPGWGV